MIFKMFDNIGNFKRIIKATNVLFIRLIATNHRKTLRFHRIIKNMGFKASLSCEEGINYINKDKERLFLLKRNNRPSRISSEKFFSKLLK